jgi:hypothetical protein
MSVLFPRHVKDVAMFEKRRISELRIKRNRKEDGMECRVIEEGKGRGYGKLKTKIQST